MEYGRGENQQEENEVRRLFSSGNPSLQGRIGEKQIQGEQRGGQQAINSTTTENIYGFPAMVEIQRKVIHEIDPARVKNMGRSDLEKHVEKLLESICDRDYPGIRRKEKMAIISALVNEFTGLGPLQEAVLDDSITEIMVNGAGQVYVEKNGQLTLTDIRFRDNEHVMQIIDKIVAPLGRRIDESSPMVDARLPNGSRVNAVIPPISLKGPVLTIRKFSSIPLTMERLVSYGSMNRKMAKFLKNAVMAKANIIVAGGTGSGKTTLLNVLSSCIPTGERIITIEDAAELNLLQPHVISMEARPPNIEGKGEITIRDMVRNSLRMRPDRIVVGEVRGAEALDMLQAMNTGHSGSLSTIHANTARDAVSRLETMVLYTGIDFPLRAVREQICSALDLIVYTERVPDGSRKVTGITEVLGIEGDTVVLQDIFLFDKTGTSNGKVQGEFKGTPIRPKIYDKFEILGLL